MPEKTVRQFDPDDVMAALLYYLWPDFSNAPKDIHEKIYELQKQGKYSELLGGFEFIDYARFHYSPILGRTLNRLQESRLLSSRNPEYMVYEIKDDTRDAIESYYLKEGKILHECRNQLDEIAKELKKEPADARA
ncbi:MAG: hypothetical protein ACYDHZ_06085 [Dehalococcoidia bacterium]